MPIEVQVGDTIVEFPDGTSPDVMRSALRKRFPPPEASQGFGTGILGMGGQAVDRALGGILGGDIGQRLTSGQSTAGRELAAATVPAEGEPAKLREIAAGLVYPPAGLAMMAGGGQGLEHGRAVQRAAVEMAGDMARDPLTYGALGALKKLGVVGKGLTTAANALFAIQAGAAVPGEFAEAKRIYDEQGFTPKVTEAIARGVLLGGAAGLGAAGTLHEGSGFARDVAPSAGRAVGAVGRAAAAIPAESVSGLSEAAGASLGGLPGMLIAKFGAKVANRILDRWRPQTEAPAAPAAAAPEIPAVDWTAPPEATGPLPGIPKEAFSDPRMRAAGPPRRPVVPQPQPAPPVEVPGPTIPAEAAAVGSQAAQAAPPTTVQEVLARQAAPEVAAPVEASGTLQGKSIQQALEEVRLKGQESPKPPDWTPEDQALSDLASQAERARLAEKDAIVRAYEAAQRAKAPGAKPATIKAADRAQKAAEEATTLRESLMARFNEDQSGWNPEYPQWSPATSAHERWMNTPPERVAVGVTPPKGGHEPVGAEQYRYGTGPLPPGAEAPPPAASAAPPVAPDSLEGLLMQSLAQARANPLRQLEPLQAQAGSPIRIVPGEGDPALLEALRASLKPELLPEGQRSMPGGRSGEAVSPSGGLKGIDTPEKAAAVKQLEELLGSLVTKPKKGKRLKPVLRHGKLTYE